MILGTFLSFGLNFWHTWAKGGNWLTCKSGSSLVFSIQNIILFFALIFHWKLAVSQTKQNKNVPMCYHIVLAISSSFFSQVFVSCFHFISYYISLYADWMAIWSSLVGVCLIVFGWECGVYGCFTTVGLHKCFYTFGTTQPILKNQTDLCSAQSVLSKNINKDIN